MVVTWIGLRETKKTDNLPHAVNCFWWDINQKKNNSFHNTSINDNCDTKIIIINKMIIIKTAAVVLIMIMKMITIIIKVIIKSNNIENSLIKLNNCC